MCFLIYGEGDTKLEGIAMKMCPTNVQEAAPRCGCGVEAEVTGWIDIVNECYWSFAKMKGQDIRAAEHALLLIFAEVHTVSRFLELCCRQWKVRFRKGDRGRCGAWFFYFISYHLASSPLGRGSCQPSYVLYIL